MVAHGIVLLGSSYCEVVNAIKQKLEEYVLALRNPPNLISCTFCYETSTVSRLHTHSLRHQHFFELHCIALYSSIYSVIVFTIKMWAADTSIIANVVFRSQVKKADNQATFSNKDPILMKSRLINRTNLIMNSTDLIELSSSPKDG